MAGLAIGLFWVVHLMACGWYLTAAYSNNKEASWVGTRRILTEPPGTQWAHSVYFVLTVFTTVGFGDILAISMAEILYVCSAMLVGTVVHSLIMSEVISTLTRLDRKNVELNKNLGIIQEFANHTHLPVGMTASIENWARKGEKVGAQLDSKGMKAFFSALPRVLLQDLPGKLFQGKLINHTFLAEPLKLIVTMPPRLPLFLASMVRRLEFYKGEIVFQQYDLPVSILLVMSGTFAYVGQNRICSRRKQDSFTDVAQGGIVHNRESTTPLAAYKLVGAGNYLGEYELLNLVGSRENTVRCESGVGVALMLSRSDLYDLCEDFPAYGAIWRKLSRLRAARSQRSLQRLVKVVPYRHLAAETIQTAYRSILKRRRKEEAGRSKQLDGTNAPGTFVRSMTTGATRASSSPLQDKGGVSFESPDEADARLDNVSLQVSSLKHQVVGLEKSVASLAALQQVVEGLLRQIKDAREGDIARLLATH